MLQEDPAQTCFLKDPFPGCLAQDALPCRAMWIGGLLGMLNKLEFGQPCRLDGQTEASNVRNWTSMSTGREDVQDENFLPLSLQDKSLFWLPHFWICNSYSFYSQVHHFWVTSDTPFFFSYPPHESDTESGFSLFCVSWIVLSFVSLCPPQLIRLS